MEAFIQMMLNRQREAAEGGEGGLDLPSADEDLVPEKVVQSFDLEGIANYIKEGKAKNIIVMAGAGISVAAGIPDFRTPGTGLYDNLQKYNLPEPTAVFDINFFREKPAPFYQLARELFPGQFQPTPTHHFIRLLHDKGLLRRCFTQNIDSLEAQAGLPKDMVVAAHGNFDGATCIETGEAVPVEEVRQAIFSDEPGCGWEALRDRYGGLVKPNITFFGEKLPDRFYHLSGLEPPHLQPPGVEPDFPNCDLLIVMGTSLAVRPFSNLVDLVPPTCPRLLINRECPSTALYNPIRAMMGDPRGFKFDDDALNYRDVLHIANSDDGVKALASLLGWTSDLEDLVQAGGGWPAPMDPPALRVKPERRGISEQTQSQVASVLQKLMARGGGGAEEEEEELNPRDHFRSLPEVLAASPWVVAIVGMGGGEAEKEVAAQLGMRLGGTGGGGVAVTAGMPGAQDEFGTAYADAVDAGGDGGGCFMALPAKAFDKPEAYGLPEGFWGWAGCGETVISGDDSSLPGVIAVADTIVIIGMDDASVIRAALRRGVPILPLGAGALLDPMLEGMDSAQGADDSASLSEAEVMALVRCPDGVPSAAWDRITGWGAGAEGGAGAAGEALCNVVELLMGSKKQAASPRLEFARSHGGDAMWELEGLREPEDEMVHRMSDASVGGSSSVGMGRQLLDTGSDGGQETDPELDVCGAGELAGSMPLAMSISPNFPFEGHLLRAVENRR